MPVFQGFKNVFFFPKNATHQVVIKRYSNSSLWEKNPENITFVRATYNNGQNTNSNKSSES